MSKYYRITYDNIGIYEALKRKVDFVEWRNILNQSTWLPKPPMYDDTCISYFTESGYKKFNTNTMPIVIKYLDKDKINIKEVTELIGDILYRDKYQVVVRQVITNKTNAIKEEMDISSIEILDESSKSKNYKKRYKNLDDFCKDFDTTEEAMAYYKFHNVKWPEGKTNDRPFSWPDDILKTFEGNCWDHAIFFYYFCKKKNIPANIYRIAVFAEPATDNDGLRWWCMGHIVNVCKSDTGWYVCDYGEGPDTGLFGPFRSEKETMETYKKIFLSRIKMNIKQKYSTGFFSHVTDAYYCTSAEQYKVYDKYYGRHDIYQSDEIFLNTLKLPYDNKVTKYTFIDSMKNTIKKNFGLLYDKLGSLFEESNIGNGDNMIVNESRLSNSINLSKDDFDENMHFIKTHAKTPKDLNTILNKFDYGYFTKNGTYYDENHVGDFSDYTTMDPHDVIKFAVGVCWDFTETEAYLFDKLFNYKITNKALKNGTYSLYYMEHDDSKGISPTHTWLAYMENDKVYLFESSWFKYQGIHEFNSEMEIMEFYDKAQRENEVKRGNKLRGGIVIKYLPVRKYGLKPLEFMTHIYKCNTSRLMKVSPEFPIHCNIQPIKEDTDMIFNEELEKGNNVIFSEDDIYCNMDKWDNHESHVLFILGLSASGKSTLSRKLAEKYKCNLIELDVIAFAITGEKAHDKGRQTWEYIKKADHMLYKFMKEKGLEPDFLRHVPCSSHQLPVLDKKDEREKQKWIDKYIHWVCFEQKERCVLEGGHACVTIANHKEYREFPIIFKGSSLLKSMIRRVKRTWIDDNEPMGPIELAKYLVILYKQYGKMFPEVNAARNAVITKDNFKIIKEYRDLEDIDMIVNESTFISDKDLVWNFDKWKRGDINLLFICGYSGGGKSTLSRILAKKYNCPLSEMDMENQEIKKTYHNELSQYGPGGTFGDPKKMGFIINKYIERYGNKERRIIEGVQLASVDFSFIKDYAVIFKGTSAVTASMRAWKRAFTDDENAERWAEDKSTLGKLKYKLQQGPNRLKTNINKVGPFMEKFYADMKKAGAKEMEYEDIVNPNTEDFHIPLLISGDDVYVNFDKWKEGKCNTLFILGLSGSGKSTLGKKLAKARKAFYVETDKIRGNSHYSDEEMRKDHPLILRWFESQYDKDRRGFNSLDKSIRKKEWDRCVEWMINQKEPKVIEGAIEEFLLEHPEYSEYPIVFKNTSMLKSIVRMTRRQLFEVDKNKVDDYNTQFLKWWLKHIQKYNDMRKRNNNVRDTIIGKKENSYEVMKESRTLKDDDVYFIKCKWEDGDKSGYTVNACKNINGEVYRVRTEMLVIKDGKVLCVKDYHDNLGLGYKLPGGSVEKGVSYAEQAAEEVKEEARIIINPKSILDTGITYIRKYTKQPRWVSHLTPPIPYVGGISYVYVGEYKSDFNGDIPDVHRDDGFYKRARFYDIDEINWIPEHKKALDMYLEKNMQKQDQSKDTYENALKIFNSLTPQEQYWMDDRYVDSPHTFYRKVHFIGRKPVGFVDTYRFHPNDPGVIIVLAVNKSYRGKGIASDLVKSATLYCKSKGIKKIIWRAHKDNYASIQLAKKLGYTKTNENEKSYRFEKTL